MKMKITLAARILSVLSDGKPCLTKTQLAEKLDANKASVASSLKKLDKLNLAWPTPDPHKTDPCNSGARNGRGGGGRFCEDLWQSNGEVPPGGYTPEQCQQFLNNGADADEMWF